MTTRFEFDSTSLPYVEGLLRDYLQEPSRISAEWRGYFDELLKSDPSLRHLANGHNGPPPSLFHPLQGMNGARIDHVAEDALFQQRARRLIEAYRDYGFSAAKLSPFGLACAPRPELTLEHAGLTEADLQHTLASPFGSGK